jgi:hypothetical protein
MTAGGVVILSTAKDLSWIRPANLLCGLMDKHQFFDLSKTKIEGAIARVLRGVGVRLRLADIARTAGAFAFGGFLSLG